MAKSRDAFRTISEVAETLDTPAHVLRFWESKFKQIKPVKRAGGRRYYRPDDLALVAAIKDLLHKQGHSIKDAQKLIRETGIKTIIANGHALLNQDAPGELLEAPTMPPQAQSPVAGDQPDLFAGSEFAPADAQTVIDDTPAPTPVNAFDVAAAKANAAPEPSTAKHPKKTLPEIPEPRYDIPGRLLGALAGADRSEIKANAAKIAPLVDRLTTLRDEMRHPW